MIRSASFDVASNRTLFHKKLCRVISKIKSVYALIVVEEEEVEHKKKTCARLNPQKKNIFSEMTDEQV